MPSFSVGFSGGDFSDFFQSIFGGMGGFGGGKGLSSKGSLYVTLTIDIPRTMTREQKELFTRLAQSE